MPRYFDYVIKNLNTGEFGVIRREGRCDSLSSHMIFATYDEAYRTARIYLRGQEPTDETTHR